MLDYGLEPASNSSCTEGSYICSRLPSKINIIEVFDSKNRQFCTSKERSFTVSSLREKYYHADSSPHQSASSDPFSSRLMAEILGIGITVPMILNGTWTILKTAYDLYGGVEMRRAQIKTHLDHCRGLLEELARHISSQTEVDISSNMQEGVDQLQR
ncbi:hypothetical protein GYMLUDRAFT_539221 [Collybiopsis luxurians FD-317 M1]|nr:hypothetical protein GYMLUDRAFT_539221 [Collybiopsis luxurians FD-317 M1]